MYAKENQISYTVSLSLRLMYHVRYIMVAATMINAHPPNCIFALSHKDSSFSTSFFMYTESFFTLLTEAIINLHVNGIINYIKSIEK